MPQQFLKRLAVCGNGLRVMTRAEQLVKAIAYLTMFATLGPMVSPIVGGVLTDTFGWRSVFGFALVAVAAGRGQAT